VEQRTIYFPGNRKNNENVGHVAYMGERRDAYRILERGSGEKGAT